MRNDSKVELQPSYPVRLRETFGGVFEALRADRPEPIGMVVIDRRVLDRHPDALAALDDEPRGRTVALNGGEPVKTLRSFERLHRAAAEFGMDRQSLVIAVGGGTIGDLAGFFASTWMRGVPWCPVATTSLAMADSAIGGKTAVNLAGAKNVVGSFHQPAGVYGALEALETLPWRHTRSGLAEVLKAGLIADADLFATTVDSATRLRALDRAAWLEVLQGANRVKADVVAGDPRESGGRAVLNFGHTVGHALEVAHRPRLTHGEAVGLGMISASWVSERLGVAPPGTTDRVREALGRLGLPRKVRAIDEPTLWRAMRYDKKSDGGEARLVLTHGIGSATVGHRVERKILQQSLSVLGEGPSQGRSGPDRQRGQES
jgi:3-dehydroquinate synthase